MKNSRNLVAALSALSFLLMGFTMPGCGADPAVKQQVEALQGKINGLEQQLKVARDESAITQKRIEDMASAMTAQSEAFNRLQARIDVLHEKAAAAKAPAPKATKPATKTATKKPSPAKSTKTSKKSQKKPQKKGR